ncbi:MAG: HEAT repeat domain-containing protein [Methylococcaceae bacterium]|nr:HEAT repeat domain-containing protein [Methylococcaceae bacterium]
MRILLLTLAAMLGISALALIFNPSPPPPSKPSGGEIKPAEIPHLERISGQMNFIPTPQDVADDAQTDQEQVRLAAEWLDHLDAETRVAGAEQLSAYPTKEAERLLREALQTDAEPSVRAAAAQGLGVFKHPSEKTVTALLTATEDRHEEVQTSALDSLQSIVARTPSDTKRVKNLVADLKKRASSPVLSRDIRSQIADFLDDQAPAASAKP